MKRLSLFIAGLALAGPALAATAYGTSAAQELRSLPAAIKQHQAAQGYAGPPAAVLVQQMKSVAADLQSVSGQAQQIGGYLAGEENPTYTSLGAPMNRRRPIRYCVNPNWRDVALPQIEAVESLAAQAYDLSYAVEHIANGWQQAATANVPTAPAARAKYIQRVSMAEQTVSSLLTGYLSLVQSQKKAVANIARQAGLPNSMWSEPGVIHDYMIDQSWATYTGPGCGQVHVAGTWSSLPAAVKQQEPEIFQPLAQWRSSIIGLSSPTQNMDGVLAAYGDQQHVLAGTNYRPGLIAGGAGVAAQVAADTARTAGMAQKMLSAMGSV